LQPLKRENTRGEVFLAGSTKVAVLSRGEGREIQKGIFGSKTVPYFEPFMGALKGVRRWIGKKGGQVSKKLRGPDVAEKVSSSRRRSWKDYPRGREEGASGERVKKGPPIARGKVSGGGRGKPSVELLGNPIGEGKPKPVQAESPGCKKRGEGGALPWTG